MKTLPHVIVELANGHGGDSAVLHAHLEQAALLDYSNLGVKFQVFSADTLSLSDFDWHHIYAELEQSPGVWAEAIRQAREVGLTVWLDLFDEYGVRVLAQHRDEITGVKLQASVIENHEVLEALRKEGLVGKKLMLNISGHDLEAIGHAIDVFRQLAPEQLILQVGFQAYPTLVEDTALNKIAVLRAAFPGCAFALADHVSGDDSMARVIPVAGFLCGCEVIEKHFHMSRKECRYDGVSALEPDEFQDMLDALKGMAASFGACFINDREREYLEKSIQIPVAGKFLPSGSLVAPSDVIYRRTSQTGLTYAEISQRQQRHEILASSVAARTTIAGEFRPAVIGAIVACRVKSSRLKQKALLPIQGVTSVERCLEGCLRMKEASVVVLATSTLEEDSVLSQHTLGGKVEFWQGDPEDVIHRYIGACERYGIDVVIRVTADCPVMFPEITTRLLESHFATGADYTAPVSCAVGSAPEIYNTEALRRVIGWIGRADCSEYMTWYMRNNSDLFKINLVELPAAQVRDYRLTLDYSEDLEMFERLFKELASRGWEPNGKNVLRILDENPAIAEINQGLTLSYRTDQLLIDKLNRLTRIVPPGS